jgi:hypothetical protein
MSDPIYDFQILHDVRLPTRDGLELSANLYLPLARAPGEKFPAVLEMIPYRKDDHRYQADYGRMTYLARRGYAGCRLDVRGTGSSQGLALDEYTLAETQDGYDAVEWLAAQKWCNGHVGMWGKSYGGFTAIQVASLQPPHLKAIVPMYATDDRYTDDVHYYGGCMVASDFAQYSVAQIAMNAMPPKVEYAKGDWAKHWKERLEQTPPWLIEWLKHQTDGPYWRSGSLAPDYTRLTCAIFHIGGWMDGYTNPVLRMQEKCVNAPRKALIGPWVHLTPDAAFPGPNVDWLDEMIRFFDYWLKGIKNGVMDEPALTLFRAEYTPPEAFPTKWNGAWHSETDYPIKRTQLANYYLGEGTLSPAPPLPGSLAVDFYPHRPTLGSRGPLASGGGSPPNGLARDLRPDEALSLTYTTEPLPEALDVIGFPEVVLHLSCSAPVAHVVVRLADVAPDGTSAFVSHAILNLTHRDSHTDPQPLTPGEIYEVRVPFKAVGYRFRAGNRIRVSVASAYWPLIWPSPHQADNYLHRGPAHPSRLSLPVVPVDPNAPPPPNFKTTPPDLLAIGATTAESSVWQIIDDVLQQSLTVRVYGASNFSLPDGTQQPNSELIEMTAYETDPARVHLYNEVKYGVITPGLDAQIHTTGSIRSTATDFHVDVQLRVTLNGNLFFHRAWLESIPRNLL